MKRLLLVMAGVIAAASFHPALPARIARLQAQASPNVIINPNTYQDLRWRSIGPHRGGRSTAAVGVRTQPNVFYMGATGGGVWKTDNYGITWSPVTDGQIADRVDRRDRRVGFESGRRLRRHGQRGDSIERDRGPRRVQVDRRGTHVAGRWPGRRRPDRPAQSPSEESGHRLRRGDWQPVRLGTRARRVSHEGRRQDLAEGAVHQRPDWRGVGRHQLVQSQRDLRRCLARAAQALDDHQRRSGGRRRRLQIHGRRRSLDARRQRIPRRSDRQGVGGRRAVEPEGRLRAGGSERREGRVVSERGQRRHVDAT